MIYVCDKCLRAACWAGYFLCDDARMAGIYRARRCDLIKLGLEHTDYMDDKSAQAPRHDKKTPTLPRKMFNEWLAAKQAEAQRA